MTNDQNLVLRPVTAKLVARIILPLIDTGLVNIYEYHTITATLNHIARHGSPLPAVQRRLIKPQETAELLGISYSELRKIDKTLPIRRRTIGKSVRYYLPEVVTLMESEALMQEVSERGAVPTQDERNPAILA